MFIKKNKIKVYSSVKNLKGKFHFIFSDQTFEHLTNPYLTLKKISKLLSKHGIIYLKVPPGVFIKNKLNENYKVGDDEIIPLEHINVFNNKVNKLMAKNLGLKHIYPKNFYPLFSIKFLKS